MAFATEQSMPVDACYAVKCSTCGKTTWKGCGQHVDSVRISSVHCYEVFWGAQLRSSIQPSASGGRLGMPEVLMAYWANEMAGGALEWPD
ncbi:hypothetical protein BDY19DRAFT_668463 [Irpex rosettiformis]|uniref:Uncharacterized protein n=1 Tax=Irpex rosettiformis TaxID=378272 RepID=A0ACB8U9T6_9APHY|nr:hypothetical protein BDY19DRAFT_668463 [Irpex rosettiformis]